MGRQFSYYAYPEDLAEIEQEVFRKLGGRLIQAEKRDGRHHIGIANEFPLALEKMGSETLFLLLAPPAPLEKLVFTGSWLDVRKSHLIEVGRSYIKDGKIGAARFWYEPTPFVEDQVVEKPKEFLTWADQIYRHTKGHLVRHSFTLGIHSYTEWCGKRAKQELTMGRIALG